MLVTLLAVLSPLHVFGTVGDKFTATMGKSTESGSADITIGATMEFEVLSEGSSNTVQVGYGLTNSIPIDTLGAITIPTYVTNGSTTYKVVEISNHAFDGCQQITGILAPEVTTVGNSAFISCTQLVEISLPKVTTVNKEAFKNCTALKTISLPEMTTIGDNAFENTGLTGIDIPKIKTIGNSTFTNLTGLTSISLPNVEVIGQFAFKNTGLTSLSLPVVTKIDDAAFQDCRSLTLLSAPTLTTVGASAFKNCSKLADVSLPKAQVIEGNAFEACSALTDISLPEATEINDNAFNLCNSLKSTSLPKATKIGDDAFSSCVNLTSISLPEVTELTGSFYRCTGLTSVSLPEAENIAGGAFNGCTSLTSVSLPKATSIGDGAFSGCTALTSVSLPKATSIEDGAFSGCTALTSVELPRVGATPNVTLIYSKAFSGCTALKTVYIGSDFFTIRPVFMEGLTPAGDFPATAEILYHHSASGWDTSGITNAYPAYPVTTNLSNIKSDGAGYVAPTAPRQSAYTATLTPETGRALPRHLSLTVDGADLELDRYSFDPISGELSIPHTSLAGITGGVELNAGTLSALNMIIGADITVVRGQSAQFVSPADYSEYLETFLRDESTPARSIHTKGNDTQLTKAADGSIVVTLSAAHTADLTLGRHSIAIYTGDDVAMTNFTVVDPPPPPTPSTTQDTMAEANSAAISPLTGVYR